MQGRTWTNPCVLHCTASAEDRIEHYCRCPHVLRFAQAMLNIAPADCTLARFLLVESTMTEAQLTLFAVLVYSVFCTTNTLRDHEETGPDVIFDMLEEHAKQAVKGHKKSCSVLYEAMHGRFIRHARRHV